MNELSHEVHVYLDVLVSLLLKWVFGEIDGNLIVARKASQMLLLESKLSIYVEATRLPDLHLPLLDTLLFLKKV